MPKEGRGNQPDSRGPDRDEAGKPVPGTGGPDRDEAGNPVHPRGKIRDEDKPDADVGQPGDDGQVSEGSGEASGEASS